MVVMTDVGDDIGYGDDDTYTDDQANWHDDLGDASGLNTSPKQGLLSLTGPATEESSSFAMVLTRSVESSGLLSLVWRQ